MKLIISQTLYSLRAFVASIDVLLERNLKGFKCFIGNASGPTSAPASFDRPRTTKLRQTLAYLLEPAVLETSLTNVIGTEYLKA